MGASVIVVPPRARARATLRAVWQICSAYHRGGIAEAAARLGAQWADEATDPRDPSDPRDPKGEDELRARTHQWMVRMRGVITNIAERALREASAPTADALVQARGTRVARALEQLARSTHDSPLWEPRAPRDFARLYAWVCAARWDLVEAREAQFAPPARSTPWGGRPSYRARKRDSAVARGRRARRRRRGS